ncbi:hypothetical protein AO1008_05148 [Aspergillus oryzae 100-8]|uniref:Ubiquitin 3 binding protein But2 C-terminal domain-containing protein n=1 Tax=Aspergillus oryzae (strain 3.042) TaxID=1160506 RepID=I8TL41_ASPO3|nr:hypothetical protein Ao3042_09484 [Aspergillus oryzae 3.042]KDE78663.1 hypothetical protein AO1008_05148 [Aspergillus oryzae 100-8]|eukprot:EIT74523.1 hypothetical protein Ao3042_09484 [Aspergillus oryzae 3.042]
MNLLLLALTLLTTLTSATPTPRQMNILYPYETYRYWVQSGNWKLDPQDQLLVVKNGNAADETTSIVTFNIPPAADGHKCKLLFDLWDRDVSSGSKQADVFTATRPTGASASDSDTGSVSLQSVSKEVADVIVQSRDEHVGRISVSAPGTADWVLAYQGYPEFDCPAGQIVGFEFVGVGDEVAIRWDIGVTGPRVQILNNFFYFVHGTEGKVLAEMGIICCKL